MPQVNGLPWTARPLLKIAGNALAAGAVTRSGDVFAPAGEAGAEFDVVFFNR